MSYGCAQFLLSYKNWKSHWLIDNWNRIIFFSNKLHIFSTIEIVVFIFGKVLSNQNSYYRYCMLNQISRKTKFSPILKKKQSNFHYWSVSITNTHNRIHLTGSAYEPEHLPGSAYEPNCNQIWYFLVLFLFILEFFKNCIEIVISWIPDSI